MTKQEFISETVEIISNFIIKADFNKATLTDEGNEFCSKLRVSLKLTKAEFTTMFVTMAMAKYLLKKKYNIA